MSEQTTFARAIRDGFYQALKMDPQVIVAGLGVDDPKGFFGTTTDLHKEFGNARVFDTPVSENGLTGIMMGASLAGVRPVLCHQRLDFALLSMDQIVNNAAKWHYMFGSQTPVPLTIRCVLGRGWGQGPTHSQALHSWFAHVPGLKVVMPSFPDDAKGLLLSSIFDDNPVIFLEHRWLHDMQGPVPSGDYRVPLGKAKTIVEGKDVTIVALSYMTIEALRAVPALRDQGVQAELIDLRTIVPLDWEHIARSVQKTGRLLVLDIASEMCSVAGEIVARAATDLFSHLKAPPRRLCLPNMPSPTSFALSKAYYKTAKDIYHEALCMMDKDSSRVRYVEDERFPHDVPGERFKGPF